MDFFIDIMKLNIGWQSLTFSQKCWNAKSEQGDSHRKVTKNRIFLELATIKDCL